MARYYFLTARLPLLTLSAPPALAVEEFLALAEWNLTAADYSRITTIRRLIDIHNIRALLLDQELDGRGNLSEKELEEAILLRWGLPAYVYDFLDRWETVADREQHFSALVGQYFEHEIASSGGFLRHYLIAERCLRLYVTAWRAQRTGRNLRAELRGEESSDPLLASLLAQKGIDSYTLPAAIAGLFDRLQAAAHSPLSEHRIMIEHRLQQTQDLISGQPLFSIDAIISYFVALLLVEDWHGLSREQGNIIFQALS